MSPGGGCEHGEGSVAGPYRVEKVASVGRLAGRMAGWHLSPVADYTLVGGPLWPNDGFIPQYQQGKTLARSGSCRRFIGLIAESGIKEGLLR